MHTEVNIEWWQCFIDIAQGRKYGAPYEDQTHNSVVIDLTNLLTITSGQSAPFIQRILDHFCTDQEETQGNGDMLGCGKLLLTKQKSFK